MTLSEQCQKAGFFIALFLLQAGHGGNERVNTHPQALEDLDSSSVATGPLCMLPKSGVSCHFGLFFNNDPQGENFN